MTLVSVDSIDEALVPAELIARADQLIAKAQGVLSDVHELAIAWSYLDGAVALLRPPETAGMTADESDTIGEAWAETSGVVTLMDLLLQIAAVAEHRTGCAAGHPRPVGDTNRAADAWRETVGTLR